eukprot:CAMPEP_0178988082 /NCGR_PEP_ID=MMETSP0795-20121207/3618_1 /TAXON_ID=88552 /ORGANISM="Amoebophrya sp., Strain Ameob2" /LENGTH=115 /DNA_ID=CAMNT_0020679327 /DNA_START=211 /DNA_END=555 /DNA_ORIENTATION=+
MRFASRRPSGTRRERVRTAEAVEQPLPGTVQRGHPREHSDPPRRGRAVREPDKPVREAPEKAAEDRFAHDAAPAAGDGCSTTKHAAERKGKNSGEDRSHGKGASAARGELITYKW